MESSNLDRTIARAIANNAAGLYLFCNRSATLPDKIGNITSLVTLHISRNQLEKLPESIGNLSNLTTLYLSYNRLASLPKSIGDLSNLTRLYVQNNQLVYLPNSIGNLGKLTHLSLDNNQLVSLPVELNKLSNLRYLNLNGNPLTDLSMLQKLDKLVTVRFINIDLPRKYWRKFSEWKPEWLFYEDNAEIRRILIEQVGYERICRELNAFELDTWREYTLLQIDISESISIPWSGVYEIDRSRADCVAQDDLSIDGAHSHPACTTTDNKCGGSDYLGKSWYSSRSICTPNLSR